MIADWRRFALSSAPAKFGDTNFSERNFHIHRLPEAALQVLPVAAAEAKFGSVGEEELVLGVAVETQFADAIEIHNGRAVNAAKLRGIEIGFEIVHAAA